jgi:hypothetical protein
VNDLISYFITLFDLTDLFAMLKGEFDLLAQSPAFTDELPLVGKSITELLTKDPVGKFGDILDFAEFVADFTAANGTQGTVNLVQTALNAFINNLADTAFTYAGDDSGTYCGGSGSDPITVTFESPVITLDFCSVLSYTGRESNLNGAGILDSVEFADLTLTATVDVLAEMTFGAQLTINVTSKTATVTFDPVEATISVSGNPEVDLSFGFIGMTSTTQLNASATFMIESCSEVASCTLSNGTRVGMTSLYYNKTGDFSIAGELTLTTELPGIDINVGATFTLVEDDVFDLSPSLNVTGFDLNDFISGFDISSLVNVLIALASQFIDLRDIPVRTSSPVPCLMFLRKSCSHNVHSSLFFHINLCVVSSCMKNFH